MDEWEIDSSLEKWEEISAEIESELKKERFSNTFIVSVMLAMDEVFANISAYAYEGGNGKVKVSTEVDAENRCFSVTFADYGKPFNPLEKIKEPEKAAALNEREMGGLGIFIAVNRVDKVSYNYDNGMNRLTMTKSEK